MKTVFVDTGYLLALELANDQNHQAAIEHWQCIVDDLPSLVTTSHVFSEVVTFFNSRRYHSKAVQVGNNLLKSPSVQFIHVDSPLFEQAWAYFLKHEDKDYSLTDCVSFMVMDKLRIRTAYTFDQHFVQAGFVREP